VCQYETRIEGVLVARVDFAYPADRVAIEFDSFRWHAGRRPFASDRARANRIEALGWHLLRVTPDDVRRGAHELCAALGALLRAAA
jgi:very-short-patch-repair endonuclease